jgi:UDP-glucose:glycoprotein glucosyltransferase
MLILIYHSLRVRSETAAQENSTSYFPLLDRIADGSFSGAKTDKELYEKFLDVLQEDGHMSAAETLSTFKLALSMRASAPRIEAHYQFYKTAVEPELVSKQDKCDNWVLSDGKQYCSPSLSEARGSISSGLLEKTLPFDTELGHGPKVILFTDITSPAFGKFHTPLVNKARKGDISYRIRHRIDDSVTREPLPVNGYGVELALKRTDYIVIDDREAQADSDQKSIASEVVLEDGGDEVADLKALSKSELSALGLRASDFIYNSESPLETLIKLSQDFPKHSTSIASHNVSEDFIKEFKANHASSMDGTRSGMVPAGLNVLWMNGVQLIERQIQSFTLLDIVRRERKLINGVLELGLTGQEAVGVLGHKAVASAKADTEAQLFDWRDEKEQGRVIIWLNNLEKDSRYADFPKSLFALLQGMGGQLPSIAKDIFNQIYPVDLTKKDDVQLVVEQLLSLVKRKVPVRFGLVPIAYTTEAANQAKIAYYLLESYGLSAMITYLQSALEADKTSEANAKLFQAAIKGRELRADSTTLSFQEILDSEQYTEQVGLANRWTNRLGADSRIPPIFVDGAAIPRDEKWMQTMSMLVNGHLRSVQEGLFYGMIEEDTWVPGIFLEKAASRRNSYIFPDTDNPLNILDVNKVYTENAALLRQVPVIEASEDSTKETWAVLTVVADLGDKEGVALLWNALQFRQNNPGIRLDIIHNPSNSAGAAAINGRLVASLDKLITADSLESLESLVSDSTHGESGSDYEPALAKFLSASKIRGGESIVILNGRVVGPIYSANSFKEDDFLLFLEYEQAQRILPVYEAIEDLKLNHKVANPLAAAKLSSITALSTISDLPEGIFESAPTLRISAFNEWNSTHTGFEVGDAATANIFFTAVINPASEQGQRWAPLLKVLSELSGVHLKVFLNPREHLDELPIKRFYRSVLQSAPTFDASGNVKALTAEFKNLPTEALLNLGLEVPPAWLVAPKVSIHDPDNIKLGSIKGNVDATYELQNILIEGHSREKPGSQPPSGAQLVLGTEANKHFADTIIMDNLGFFQFKANPGYYNIQLQEGRSTEIFTIESVGPNGMAETPGDEGTDATLMDFQGTTLYPRLVRNPGMEDADILAGEGAAEETTGGGAMDYVAKGLKFFGGGSKEKAKAKAPSASDLEHAEINIFSVASGHLYERMLNIMMVSVMRHTNHTVKFWFIEQFLSPSFKDFIPTMAAEYGFKYEMVTYKWPHWLRQQKEKQREIWGYKILFLDVLFPLSLDKVIFVDADQIVRTDMYELVNYDLGGAPYGFTPMCDSRTEMEGFRFWKQGYWNNYLKGKPYHISALYVVDLRRFRELGSGDRLRQTYHQLSADPHSLANLDQDLPNHMQFQIPIHSLPQDWLWCETWCSDESQETAKTIDLCNNPQTKEPKLDRARRQVPEWTVYDDEIAALDRRRKGLPVADTKKQGESQKVVGDDKAAQTNTMSRRLDEEPGVHHTKDEL